MLKSKKNFIIFSLLFLVFISINSKWVWRLMYPIEYEETIKAYSVKYDVDPYLVLSIIQVETRFNEKKISKKGAVGLMQIMPETAEWLVEQGGFPLDHVKRVHEPEINIELGSMYLSSIYHQFSKNNLVTIAAYNAGPGNVNKWIKSGDWDGSLKNLNRIPYGETRHYIQRVLFYYDKYKWIYNYNFR